MSEQGGRGGRGGRGGGRGWGDNPRGRAGRGRSTSFTPGGAGDHGGGDDDRPGPPPGGHEDQQPAYQDYRDPSGGDGQVEGRSEGSEGKRGSSDKGSEAGRSGRERQGSMGSKDGRGRGGGRRGARRDRFDAVEKMDVVMSRPQQYTGDTGKKGISGTAVNLIANFFNLNRKTDWGLYNYRVDFKPDEERTFVKKSLLKPHAASIGPYIFDGHTLYVAHKLQPEPMTLHSVRDGDNERIEVIIRLVAELQPGDNMYLQFFNITLRKCLSMMKLEELGRYFYDRDKAIKMPELRLELWKGYVTSMRNYEHNVMLNVEITHKVLRQETVLQVISQMRGSRNPEKAITDELVGTIVMTHYNRKTYRIDDIDWENTPASTFDKGDEKVSFADYYQQRYQLQVREMRQPLLISRPKRRDMHRGMTGPILLIPEFCQMTGLTDAMRANHSMMRELATHLHMGAQARLQSVEGFMQRLKSNKEVEEDLKRWGMDFDDKVVSLQGRVMPSEVIQFDGGPSGEQRVDDKADWTIAFRSKRLLTTKDLVKWVIIVPQRDSGGVENLVRTMQQVSRPLNFNINQPLDVMRLPGIQIPNYIQQIDQAMANYEKREGLQLIFVVLPNNKAETYSAVKRRCVVDYGMLSQCYLAKNINARGLMAIATKCVVQMAAKLGGEPWKVANPLKTSMVIGFDVYHCGKRKGASVGAMVASTSPTWAKYFSTVSFHSNREDLSSNLCTDVTKCVHAYAEVNNGSLPDRIIMYRDGVGEGQLAYVYGTELEQIKVALKSIYTGKGVTMPKFSFIVCNKKINTRIFSAPGYNGNVDNPKPGSIVDDVITLPERYDFFLISQSVRQGTVSPTAYNVLYDEQGLKPDQIQRLTYKMCHMYFNWSGTVAVPAPCQYAHKLAYLTGMALKDTPNDRMSHLLYYL